MPWHVGLRVLLKMKLASLPFRSREASGERGLDPFVVVRRDALNAVESTLMEFFEERSPVDFGFRQRDAPAQNGPFAVLADTDGDEDGAIDDGAPVSNLFAACIHD